MSMDRPVARGRSVVCAGETTRSGPQIGYERRKKKEMEDEGTKRSESTNKLEELLAKKQTTNGREK